MKKNKILCLILSSTMILGSTFSTLANENNNNNIKTPRAFTKVYTPYVSSSQYTPVMYDTNSIPSDDTIRIIFDDGADPNKTEDIMIKVTEYMALGDHVEHYVNVTEGSSAKIQLQKAGNDFGMEVIGLTEGRIEITVTLGSQ